MLFETAHQANQALHSVLEHGVHLAAPVSLSLHGKTSHFDVFFNSNLPLFAGYNDPSEQHAERLQHAAGLAPCK